ncbi:MAG: hypothetical protein ACRETU_12975, partial [Steroidobacterales bacterium]
AANETGPFGDGAAREEGRQDDEQAAEFVTGQELQCRFRQPPVVLFYRAGARFIVAICMPLSRGAR